MALSGAPRALVVALVAPVAGPEEELEEQAVIVAAALSATAALSGRIHFLAGAFTGLERDWGSCFNLGNPPRVKD